MRIIVQTISIIAITVQTFTLAAQAPLVKMWDRRFGVTDSDGLFSFQQTTDGGYILGGYSYSEISGDKTQPVWGGNYSDYWIVKLDSSGNKEWDKRFGGTSDDYFYSMQQTADKGYILGGWSTSDSSGDKTQDNWIGADYWIVKTDSSGNKEWDKRFGGISDDDLLAVRQATDGGYILGGTTYSDGIYGDKTQANWGNFFPDYWIVKTDASGNKEWDKRFGGYSTEYFSDLLYTADGGFILGASSNSGVNGDKTSANWGGYDYWIVKTDASGNRLWDKTYGGNAYDYLDALEQTSDGGYILAGLSLSDSNGLKTQPSQGNWDYWIVKVDSLGNKQWDATFGGSGIEEDIGNVFETMGGGYLVTGTSQSPASGDKSENNLGTMQIWMVKMDALGNKQWDKTILTTRWDEPGYTVQTGDNCYVMADCNYSGVGGDKTQLNWDTTNQSYDYWIIKFCDSSAISSCSLLNVTTNSVTAHVTCLGASDGAAKAVASGGTPPYSFLWSDGQATDVPTGFPAGEHSVTVTDYNGCTATTSINIAEGPLPCTGIQDNPLNNISLYPNPTDGTVTLKAAGMQGQVSLRLYDALGRQVFNLMMDGSMLQQGLPLDLKDATGSVFFLNISAEKGNRVMKVGRH